MGQVSVPNRTCDFLRTKMPRIITKINLFSKDNPDENRFIRLLGKHLAVQYGKFS